MKNTVLIYVTLIVVAIHVLLIVCIGGNKNRDYSATFSGGRVEIINLVRNTSPK